MRSRLSFGLSMAFNFDYYLVDEITAVGDARFKENVLNFLKQSILNLISLWFHIACIP